MPHSKLWQQDWKEKTEQGIKFYRVPAVITDKGELIEKLTAERRRKWISAISRDLTEKKLSDDRVCSVHFVSGKPAKIGIDTIRTGYLLSNLDNLSKDSTLQQLQLNEMIEF